jgi:TetR/AcrR family acrAB operon transcriptional repressor
MARKTKEDAAITREQLLDAAERVFRQRGVARSSLAEVASAAGVTRGAVYWHFRDKADLCAAMCERAMLPLETMLSDAGATTHDDPLRTLRELAVAALTHLARDPRTQAVFEVFLHESDHAPGVPSIAERKERERRHCLGHVERVLQQAVAARQLPDDADTALAAQAMHAYIGGIMNAWVQDTNAYDLEACAPALVDAIIAGLRAAPPLRVVSPRERRARIVSPTAAAVGPSRAKVASSAEKTTTRKARWLRARTPLDEA